MTHLHRFGGYKKQGHHPLKPKTFDASEVSKRKGLVLRNCPSCHKDFGIYKSLTKNTKNSYCSPKCYEEGRDEASRYATRMGKHKQGVRNTLRRMLKKGGFFSGHKEEYKDKIVNYRESPTGKAYVGINKSPFMPAKDGGHGYQGVLMQDENRLIVQCHACGQWMKRNSDSHLKKCSGLTVKQYKAKYGLNDDHGLVSDETSLRLTKAALKNKDNAAKLLRVDKKCASVMGRGGRTKGHSMEFFNKYGTCPLQLKTRLYEFIRCNRELPSQGNRGRPIYKALRRRYGSFSHALTAHGLPFMKRKGTNMYFGFSDGTHYTYNINQMHDREALYKMMMEKCSVLTDPNS